MSKQTKTLSIALQGGGAHGAFAWGALEGLLADERVAVEGVSAASTGALNAVVFAQGYLDGGPEGAREALGKLWHKISTAASMLPLRPSIVDKFLGNTRLEFSPSFVALDFLTRVFSPYEFNMVDLNPLRDIVDEMVNFDALRKNRKLKLFINATQVRTGRVRVFSNEELSLDVVMASACLPFLFKTVEIDGEPYWDGGYSGNPALFPLVEHCASPDIVLVQVNPLFVEDVPTRAPDILDRVNEISFNATLMSELRALAFIQHLLSRNKLSPQEFKPTYVHMIEAGELLAPMGRSSKLNADWEFLRHLRDVGSQAALDWLNTHHEALGTRSTLDVAAAA